jgi:hypothetical protein
LSKTRKIIFLLVAATYFWRTPLRDTVVRKFMSRRRRNSGIAA